MIKRTIIRVMFLTLILALIAIKADTLDYPHTGANNITCDSCHFIYGTEPSLLPEWTAHVPQDIDDTQHNMLCWSCHNGLDTAYVRTHSSLTIDGSYGSWTVECKTCHNPHKQEQFKTYGSASYLYQGVVSGVTATTLTESGAGWTPDEYVGLLLVPNVSKVSYNYQITGNTGDTLTVKGAIDTARVSAGNTFAIVYGKLVKSTIKLDDITTYIGVSTGIPDVNTIVETGAGWQDNQYAGFEVIPNASQPSYRYKITSNNSDTLTVQGPMDLAYVDIGDIFKIVAVKTGDKTVRFFKTSGTNSYADVNTTYDGICEVCHTQTDYHTNDGIGLGHYAGTDCMQCHNHVYGFAHGIGGGAGVNCEECHGHDAGYEYEPGKFSQGSGSYQSHSTHTEDDSDDLRGPYITCTDCHDTTAFPYFKSGADINLDGNLDLSETDVCDTCHSPGGTYDGVDDALIGAKNNWSGIGSSDSPIYEADGSIKSGREKWCAGCHDEVPSVIQSISAPNVIGDEDQNTNYGIGYGYYKTGHGLPTGLYPASQAPAANKGCLDCHDSSTAHIDGDPRTYSAAGDNYQAGYRLKDVSGGLPMDIPRSGLNADDFALCFECHSSDPYMVQTDMTTNFRNDSTGVNGHWTHLINARPWNSDWDSSWDGAPGDSNISCPTCHNVHGSPSPRMVRHGELISTPGTTDKVPALDFRYLPSTNPMLAESTGGTTRFIPGGPGSIAGNGVCNMCHNNMFTYYRTPTDMYSPQISFVYGEVGSDQVTISFTEGVYSDIGATGDLVIGDLVLTDDDNRTITGVTHTSGQDYAVLTLSSDLDSDDIGIDEVAAQTASIYDASGNPMDTTPVTISGDTAPPTMTNRYPADGASDVALNSNLTFFLSDSGIGIDWTTFSIQLSGDDIGDPYSKTYTNTDTSVVSKTGAPANYYVTIQPDAFFNSGETITVTVNVDDLAGHSLVPPPWSFATADAPIWETPDALYDSLYLGSPGNLIDDNFSTGNAFGAGGPNHYATFKLESEGDLYDVTDVRIYGGPSYYRTWRIYVSRDGLVYKYMQSFSVGGASQWYEYTLPSTETARYIRINAWHPGPENAEVAFEFQFKGTPVVNNNNAPSLSWTGEAGYTTDGVDPDSAPGGTDFEFRVEYTDDDNNAPTLIQVWVDISDNDSYESAEKYNLAEVDSGDTDYTDGKLYTVTRTIAGDGNTSYRFVASDGTDPATGDPTTDSQFYVINDAPTLLWTGEVGYTTDGVDPDSGAGGTDFEFRIKYTDANNEVPSIIQVWIDENDSDSYESAEKYNLTEADPGDTDYTDGKLYTTTKSVLYAGDGNISYRFVASDGNVPATGDPTVDNQINVTNNAPILAWTGETLFTPGGVYPDSATSGNSFEFRISYSDIDNTVPTSIQVWVDQDDSGTYEDIEKYDMTELDSGDTVLTDGKLYSVILPLNFAGDGDLNYHFYASDGTDDAVGDPVSDSVVNVVYVDPGSENIAPTLAWTGETNYTDDGIDPDIAIGGSEFVFRISYADSDNDIPASIQVWMDEDDSGTYDADEKYDLVEADAGDTDYTDGKFYTTTLTPAHGSDRILNYRFYASDGTDVATGTPVFDSTVIVTNENVPTGAVGFWKFEEGSGTSALDETVNLNDGTINGAVRTAGISGDGLSFDGTNDYVQVPDDDSLDLTNAGSIEVWAYKNTQKNYQMYVAKGHSQSYQLLDYATTGRIALRWGSDTNGLVTDEVVSTGSWHHIVGTYDGSLLKIYIDGNLSKSADYMTDAVANATPVRIGARDNGYYFDGIIDEVVIYNQALTDTEVMERYNLYGP